MRPTRPAAIPCALATAALAGVAGCAGLPVGAPAHPDAGQPASPFSMAERRCAAQGKDPAVRLGEPIGQTRITGQTIYRGASLVCE